MLLTSTLVWDRVLSLRVPISSKIFFKYGKNLSYLPYYMILVRKLLEKLKNTLSNILMRGHQSATLNAVVVNNILLCNYSHYLEPTCPLKVLKGRGTGLRYFGTARENYHPRLADIFVDKYLKAFPKEV